MLKDRQPITTGSGDIDTEAIFREIAAVKKSMNERFEQNDKEHKEIWAKLEGVNDLERLRAEFDQLKNKDFKELEARVTALEKQLREALQKL